MGWAARRENIFYAGPIDFRPTSILLSCNGDRGSYRGLLERMGGWPGAGRPSRHGLFMFGMPDAWGFSPARVEVK